ncbi:MAG: AMP-binding protein [Rothia sp. (in: high G+C Gram-positive bacteria)]|nr:AMP-binding protein [Rothia sp. (in: high G+C Gram-positive bacteria)]
MLARNQDSQRHNVEDLYLAQERFNLAWLVQKQRENEHSAVIGQGSELSYRELYEAIGGTRIWLSERGVKAGERCAISLPNVVQMPILYYAALSLGAIVVPLNPLLSAREINYHLHDSQACLLVCWQGSRAADEIATLDSSRARIAVLNGESTFIDSYGGSKDWEAAPVRSDDPAVILYTSGTTGTPKGAVLTHSNVLSNATTCAQVFGFTTTDVIFGGLPLFHAFGQTVSMNAVFAAGATIALLARFTPESAAVLCESAQVSVLAAVPSMYTALASYCESRDVSSLRGRIRFGISGGSALLASTHADFARLLDCPIYEGYGLSETSPVVSFNQAQYGLIVGSVGRAIPGVDVQVRDERRRPLAAGEAGQLWVRGANVMAQYWNNPEATAEVFDGEWFATGDVARVDEQGNIFIVDRLKDMVLRNGYSVYPREIEDIIDQHPAIRQVAVVGKPHQVVGEEIVAVVVAKEALDIAAQNELIQDLDRWCRKNLAAYKYPREYKVVRELPLGPTGKILKREIVAGFNV